MCTEAPKKTSCRIGSGSRQDPIIVSVYDVTPQACLLSISPLIIIAQHGRFAAIIICAAWECTNLLHMLNSGQIGLNRLIATYFMHLLTRLKDSYGGC